jgi:hypothetical protein
LRSFGGLAHVEKQLLRMRLISDLITSKEKHMTDSTTLETLIPHRAPTGRVPRTLLFAIRRLAAGGLNDAQAATLFMANFGLAYRRPLLFLRILISEVSRVAGRPITIAPCCCHRMTDGEAAFLFIIEQGRTRPEVARARIAHMAATLDCLPALSVAQALADALDDIGHPLTLAEAHRF